MLLCHILAYVQSTIRTTVVLIRSLPVMSRFSYPLSAAAAPADVSNMHPQPQLVPNIIYLNNAAAVPQSNAGQNLGLVAVVPSVGLVNLSDEDAQRHVFSAVWEMTPRAIIFRHMIETVVSKLEECVTFVRKNVFPYLPGTKSLSVDAVAAAPVCPNCKQSSRPWFMNPPELLVVGTFIRSSIIVYLTVLREAANCALSML